MSPDNTQVKPNLRIGIIGLGLIGGSLSYALSRGDFVLFGVDIEDKTLAKAESANIFHSLSKDISILNDVDIVFICSPVHSAYPVYKEVINVVKRDCVVTDVCSVKSSLVSQCLLDGNTNFIGGHPMCGREVGGFDSAVASLFKKTSWVLTPIKPQNNPAIKTLKLIIQFVGAKPLIMTPEKHDEIVAKVSHLPAMVSTTLLSSLCGQDDNFIFSLASSGFRDVSRTGGGSIDLRLGMSKFNRDFLLDEMKNYREKFDNLITLIENEDWQKLENIFRNSKDLRKKFSFFINKEIHS